MRSLVRFLAWGLLAVGLLLGILRATVLRWFWLPTNDPIFETSVIPSLRGGDLILTSRITSPKFGDLVVCPEPDHPERYVIGRIIGEPGDEVEIINGEPRVGRYKFIVERNCDPGKIKYPNPDNEAEEVVQYCDMEAIANHLHRTGGLGGHEIRPETLTYTVTEGKFFLISDNRLYHYDSRDFGLVDIDSCKETVFLRLVSKEGWLDAENRLNYIQ